MVLVIFPGIRSIPVFGGEEKQVTIYVDASARDYGKSWKRVGTRSIFFREFSSTRTLETTDPDGILTAVLLDVRLGRAGRGRGARMAQELPTVLEFLALCLTAGEGVLDALRRVTSVGTGEVVGSLRRAVLEVGTGSTLSESLSRVGRDAPHRP